MAFLRFMRPDPTKPVEKPAVSPPPEEDEIKPRLDVFHRPENAPPVESPRPVSNRPAPAGASGAVATAPGRPEETAAAGYVAPGPGGRTAENPAPAAATPSPAPAQPQPFTASDLMTWMGGDGAAPAPQMADKPDKPAKPPGIGPEYAPEDFFSEPVRTVDPDGRVRLTWETPAAPPAPPPGIGPQYAPEDFGTAEPTRTITPDGAEVLTWRDDTAPPAPPPGIGPQYAPEDFGREEPVRTVTPDGTVLLTWQDEPTPTPPVGSVPYNTYEGADALDQMRADVRAFNADLSQVRNNLGNLPTVEDNRDDALANIRVQIHAWENLAMQYPQFAGSLEPVLAELRARESRIENPPPPAPVGISGSSQARLELAAKKGEIAGLEAQRTAILESQGIIPNPDQPFTFLGDPISGVNPAVGEVAFGYTRGVADESSPIPELTAIDQQLQTAYNELDALRDQTDPGWRSRYQERIFGASDAELAQVNKDLAAVPSTVVSSYQDKRLAIDRTPPRRREERFLASLGPEELAYHQLLQRQDDIAGKLDGGGSFTDFITGFLPFNPTVSTVLDVTHPDSPGGVAVTPAERLAKDTALTYDFALSPLYALAVGSAPGVVTGAIQTTKGIVTRQAIPGGLAQVARVTGRSGLEETGEVIYEEGAGILVTGNVPTPEQVAGEFALGVGSEVYTEILTPRGAFLYRPGFPLIPVDGNIPGVTGTASEPGIVVEAGGQVAPLVIETTEGVAVPFNPYTDALKPVAGGVEGAVAEVDAPGRLVLQKDGDLPPGYIRLRTPGGDEMIIPDPGPEKWAESGLWKLTDDDGQIYFVLPQNQQFVDDFTPPPGMEPLAWPDPATETLTITPEPETAPAVRQAVQILPGDDTPQQEPPAAYTDPDTPATDTAATVTQPQPAVQPQPQPAVQPEVSVAVQPTTQASTVTQPQTVTQAGPQVSTVVQPITQPQTGTETITTVEPVIQPEPVKETTPEPITVVEPITQVKPKTETQVKPAVKPEPVTVSPGVAVQPEVKTDTKTQVQVQRSRREPGEGGPDITLKPQATPIHPKAIQWIGKTLHRLDLESGLHTIVPVDKEPLESVQVVQHTPRPVDSSLEAGPLAVRTQGGQADITLKDRRHTTADIGIKPEPGGGGSGRRAKRRRRGRGGRDDDEDGNKAPMDFRLMVVSE